MFVAQKLRKESIAEYLLYMWQIEDIIRAYGCSLPVIKKNYIERFDFTPEQKDEELDWFGNLRLVVISSKYKIALSKSKFLFRLGVILFINFHSKLTLILC